MSAEFQHIGWYKEYFVNNKFVGTLICEKDREVVGYNGRTKEVLSERVILDNKKIIKQGVEVMTIMYPLCGKQIKNNLNS